MTEAILRGPFPVAKNDRSALPLLIAHTKIISFAAIALISPIIALYVELAARNPHISSGMMDSRIRLMSMIQDWNITSLERLVYVQSPPARAGEWILSVEIDWNEVDTLKKKFALATLFFTTHSPHDDYSWTNHDNWLSSLDQALKCVEKWHEDTT